MTLYVMMGVSSFLIWRKDLEDKPVRIAMTWYIIQIILNAIWTPLFFGMQSPLLGLIDIIPLLAAIIVTIVFFFKISTACRFASCPVSGLGLIRNSPQRLDISVEPLINRRYFFNNYCCKADDMPYNIIDMTKSFTNCLVPAGLIALALILRRQGA